MSTIQAHRDALEKTAAQSGRIRLVEFGGEPACAISLQNTLRFNLSTVNFAVSATAITVITPA
jgi:hypothetical protein